MKRVQIPIYGGVLVACASNEEFERAYARMVRKLGTGEPDADSYAAPGGLTTSAIVDGELQIISGEWDGSSTTAGGSTRCHEAVHCAQAVALHIGLDPLKEQEAFAHLTSWFYEQLEGAQT